MADLSDYLEQALFDHVFRGVVYTAPGTVYVSAHTANPTDAGGGETSGTSYARVAVAATTAEWNAHGTAGPGDNVNAITFPTAGGSWGTISHIGIYDDPSAGNLLMYGALSASKAITTDDTLQIAAGALDITFA